MLEPYWTAPDLTLHLGDCLDVLRTMPDASVDAVVTDPPAGISFMGKTWDADKGGREAWVSWLTHVMAEAFRVLKPGGHALVWALPRTSHWTATALEDAGFTIRDCVVHLFGSGFPKSLDVSRAIDKAAGVEREVVGVAADFARDGAARSTNGSHVAPHHEQGGHGYGDRWSAPVTSPATEEAIRWSGWGTALKPSQEHWWLVRKPFAGTVAQTVLEYGTGALNIDATRVEAGSRPLRLSDRTNGNDVYGDGLHGSYAAGETTQGRWPTNLVLTHSALCVEDRPCEPGCPVDELDRQSGVRPTHSGGRSSATAVRDTMAGPLGVAARGGYDESGGASRFYPTFRYEAKAPASERPKLADGTAHATVKPLALMRFLTRLITPPGGVVLDPFAGSGTTGEAAIIEGFRAVLIELDQAHAELIKKRLSKPLQPSLDLFAEVTSDGA